MTAFRDFIKHKRVAFVGACPNLQDKKLGIDIDRYSVVCKSNGSLYLDSPEYSRDYGSRIDVLYTNNQFYREMYPEFADAAYKKGIKFLRMKTVKQNDLLMINQKVSAEVITGAIKKVNFPGATMGCYILADLLACFPKEVHLTGVDFFLSKKKVFEHDNYREYLRGYLPDRIRQQGNLINQGKTQDGHDLIGSAKWILRQYRYFEGVLTMPKFIEDILMGIVSGQLKQE